MAERPQSIAGYRATYEETLGFVPPRVQSRFEALAEADPDLLLAQERLRNVIMYPDALFSHRRTGDPVSRLRAAIPRGGQPPGSNHSAPGRLSERGGWNQRHKSHEMRRREIIADP